MKKYLFFILSAILFSINVNASEVSKFDKIFVNLPAKVRILESDKYEVNVLVSDSVLYKSVDYNVIDGVLKLSKKRDDINYDDLRIIIFTPSVPKLMIGSDYLMTEIKDKKVDSKDEI